jgi:hypothetical protein
LHDTQFSASTQIHYAEYLSKYTINRISELDFLGYASSQRDVDLTGHDGDLGDSFGRHRHPLAHFASEDHFVLPEINQVSNN